MRLFVVKLLIFSLLIIFVLGVDNDQKSFKQKCNKASGYLLDPKDVKAKKICIVSEDIKSVPSEDKTEATITFNNVNVDDIDVKSNQLTISMEIRITWAEKRLLLNKKSISVNRKKYQNKIWSPEFTFRTSDSLTKLKLIFSKDSNDDDDSSISAIKSFNIETTRKCHMDFQSFPFDKQECIFEVNLFKTLVF